MFLNPWYSGQQQQQPNSNSSNPGETQTGIVESAVQHPVGGGGDAPENLSNGGGGNSISGNGSAVNINNQHVSAAMLAGPSPAASPRLLPRSSPRLGLDNRNQQADLEDVQRRLRSGWTAHTTPDGRYYYCK